MIYRCMIEKCPHGAEPCEMSTYDYNSCMHSSPCPIGEGDPFMPVDDENEFFCMIIGTRTFDDYETMKDTVDKMLINKKNKDIVVVSGGANGADSLAEQYAREKGYQLVVFPANWDEEGKRAGYNRNKRMHEYLSKKEDKGVIAFWDGASKGTAHSFSLSKKYHNPIKCYNYKEKVFVKV